MNSTDHLLKEYEDTLSYILSPDFEEIFSTAEGIKDFLIRRHMNFGICHQLQILYFREVITHEQYITGYKQITDYTKVQTRGSYLAPIPHCLHDKDSLLNSLRVRIQHLHRLKELYG